MCRSPPPTLLISVSPLEKTDAWKLNESIIIGDDIKITILGTKGQDVKIGIEAPEDVEIWREEIL